MDLIPGEALAIIGGLTMYLLFFLFGYGSRPPLAK
jgi:hypothetical protein